MEMIISVWIIILGAIVITYRVCDTVERVVETKEVSKYRKLLEKEWKK